MKTKNLLTEFCNLPIKEKETIIELLIDHLEQQDGQLGMVMKEIESCQIKNPSCIYCESTHTIKRARIKSIQRFSCNKCGKYWMATHGTSLAGLRKRNLWQKYIQVFGKGYSIRKAAEELGISIQTSFRWRHRLLASISCHLPTQLSGIVETDDFQLPLNTKGQRKPISNTEPNGSSNVVKVPTTISVVLSASRTRNESLSSVIASELPRSEQMKKALQNKIHSGSILIAKAVDSFSFLKNEEDLKYQPLYVRRRSRKNDPVNLSTARMHQEAFKEFLLPFNGVATKYLQNYLNWYHYRERIKMRMDKMRYSIRTCFTGDHAMEWLEDLTIKDTIIIT